MLDSVFKVHFLQFRLVRADKQPKQLLKQVLNPIPLPHCLSVSGQRSGLINQTNVQLQTNLVLVLPFAPLKKATHGIVEGTEHLLIICASWVRQQAHGDGLEASAAVPDGFCEVVGEGGQRVLGGLRRLRMQHIVRVQQVVALSSPHVGCFERGEGINFLVEHGQQVGCVLENYSLG